MTELYFSLVDVKHLLNHILKYQSADGGIMLLISSDEDGTYLTSSVADSPRCNTVKESGSQLEESDDWEEEFPVNEKFFSSIQEADNWGHLVLELSEDEMNVFIEENGMTGCLN